MPPMDDLRRLEAKGLARAKIRAKRRRVSSIRNRTIRGSLALFAIAWAIVFGQLVTGNDPALSRTRKLFVSTHPSKQAASPPTRLAPESEEEEEEGVVVGVESEPAPEVEVAPEAEVEPAPEPAPVITAAS